MANVAKSTLDGAGASFNVLFDDGVAGGLIALAKIDTTGGAVEVVDAESKVTYVDRSGTSTGSAITVAANPARRVLIFQNTSDTDFRISWWGTASASAGLLIPPNSSPIAFYGPACPVEAISVFCGVASKTYTMLEG